MWNFVLFHIAYEEKEKILLLSGYIRINSMIYESFNPNEKYCRNLSGKFDIYMHTHIYMTVIFLNQ